MYVISLYIIAYLFVDYFRHAKIVHDQSTREKVLSIQPNEVKIATVNPVSDRKAEIVITDKISRNLKSVRKVFTDEDDKIQAKTMRIDRDNIDKGAYIYYGF